MPTYYIARPYLNPNGIEAPTALEAVIAAGIWEHDGWAATYADDPETIPEENAWDTVHVQELDDDGEPCDSQYVRILAVLDAIVQGTFPQHKRMEDY